MDTTPRENIWGVAVVDDREKVEMASPLAGRWLRYWPWPYGKTTTKTGLAENIAGTAVQLKAERKAEAEELRLLYVTLTRARDYLILSTSPKGNPWLELALSRTLLHLPVDAANGVQMITVGEGEDVPLLIARPTSVVTEPSAPTAVVGIAANRSQRVSPQIPVTVKTAAGRRCCISVRIPGYDRSTTDAGRKSRT